MTTDLTLFKKNALTMNERFQRMMEDTDRIAGMGAHVASHQHPWWPLPRDHWRRSAACE